MLTELQKNVAVRLSIGTPVKIIADEFNISVRHVSIWLRASEFVEYKDSLTATSRARVIQYLDSKQMKYLNRLEDLSVQEDDLRVAKSATTDLLGFTRLENSNIPHAPVVNTQVNINTSESPVDEEKTIDAEIVETEKLLDGEPSRVGNK